jgi:hypothetical protein
MGEKELHACHCTVAEFQLEIQLAHDVWEWKVIRIQNGDIVAFGSRISLEGAKTAAEKAAGGTPLCWMALP